MVESGKQRCEMAEKECKHHYQSTGEKGSWAVKVVSLNRRGNPADERVPTTVFRCTQCGHIKEYPDYWERNFLLPTNNILNGITSPADKKKPVGRKTRKPVKPAAKAIAVKTIKAKASVKPVRKAAGGR